MDWVDKLSREKRDDAAELRRKEKSRPHAEYIAAQIAAYLDDKLSADEMNVLYERHGEAIERERVRREQAAAREKVVREHKALTIWDDVYTQADADAADQAIHDFCLAHPEFKRTIPTNGKLLLDELRGNNELVTVDNLERAYNTLRPMGVFQESTPEEKRIRQQSADDFLREHRELHDTRTPPLARAAVEKALVTFASLRPEYVASSQNATMMMGWLSESGLPPTAGNVEAAFDALRRNGQLELSTAVIHSGATKFVDYGDSRPRGMPPRPDKASFRKKIEVMTSKEIAEACRLDPAFERALNDL